MKPKEKRHDNDVAIEFDLSKAVHQLTLQDEGGCRTPTATPVKKHNRHYHYLMNGVVPALHKGSGSDATLFDFLTPSTVASSASLCSGGTSSCESSPNLSSERPNNLNPSPNNIKSVSKTLCFHIGTIQEEGVEVTLHKQNEVNTSSLSASTSEDCGNGLNALNSSIVVHKTPTKGADSTALTGAVTPETPAAVGSYCGGWLCAAADTEKHICESLGVEHLVCWQSTMPSRSDPSPPPRRYRRNPQLHNIRRNLQFHQPLQQSTSFQISPSRNIPTPKKSTCFPVVCTRKEVTPSKSNHEDEGYGSDPETYVTTSCPIKTSSDPPRHVYRATTVDELFNERIPCLLHTSTRVVPVTLFLERGHLQYANATPRLCCARDGKSLDIMALLEISKILCPSTPPYLVAADPNRCLTVRSCQGHTWTLEIAALGVAANVAHLLKLAVATLAAAVLTEQTVDRMYFDG